MEENDFHWHVDPVPLALKLHRKHQQDALRFSWVGLVAGTDGSVDIPSEKMGAGYVVGDAPIPLRVLAAPLGGPVRHSAQKQLVSSNSCAMSLVTRVAVRPF